MPAATKKKTGSVLLDYLNERKGQGVAILCSRYIYRGILQEVDEGGVVLSEPFIVEVASTSDSERSESESPCVSDLFISANAIEMVYQPVWAFHGYKE